MAFRWSPATVAIVVVVFIVVVELSGGARAQLAACSAAQCLAANPDLCPGWLGPASCPSLGLDCKHASYLPRALDVDCALSGANGPHWQCRTPDDRTLEWYPVAGHQCQCGPEWGGYDCSIARPPACRSTQQWSDSVLNVNVDYLELDCSIVRTSENAELALLNNRGYLKVSARDRTIEWGLYSRLSVSGTCTRVQEIFGCRLHDCHVEPSATAEYHSLWRCRASTGDCKACSTRFHSNCAKYHDIISLMMVGGSSAIYFSHKSVNGTMAARMRLTAGLFLSFNMPMTCTVGKCVPEGSVSELALGPVDRSAEDRQAAELRSTVRWTVACGLAYVVGGLLLMHRLRRRKQTTTAGAAMAAGEERVADDNFLAPLIAKPADGAGNGDSDSDSDSPEHSSAPPSSAGAGAIGGDASSSSSSSAAAVEAPAHALSLVFVDVHYAFLADQSWAFLPLRLSLALSSARAWLVLSVGPWYRTRLRPHLCRAAAVLLDLWRRLVRRVRQQLQQQEPQDEQVDGLDDHDGGVGVREPAAVAAAASAAVAASRLSEVRVQQESLLDDDGANKEDTTDSLGDASRFRTVLRGVSGCASPGDVVGLVGPSGAGKTSLLRLLAGMQGQLTSQHSEAESLTELSRGRVALVRGDGVPFHGPRPHHIAFVHQDAQFVETQTIREALWFAAVLADKSSNSSNSRSDGDRDDNNSHVGCRVNAVLRELDLLHVQDSAIGLPDAKGSISGGERRRVAVGVKLVTEPGCLLLDEPVSGLDSYNARQLLAALQAISRRGCPALLSIHQLSALLSTYLTSLIVVSRHGHMLYNGPPDAAVAFFSKLGYQPQNSRLQTMGEYVLEIATRMSMATSRAVSEGFAASEHRKALDDRLDAVTALANQGRLVAAANAAVDDDGGDDAVLYPARPVQNVRQQFACVARRALSDVSRRPSLIATHALGTLLVALVMSFLFSNVTDDITGSQNRLGFLYFATTYFTFTAMTAAGTFVERRRLYASEIASGAYGAGPLYWALVVADLVALRLFQPMLFSVSYFLVGLQERGDKFFAFCFTCVTCHVIATCLAYCVSTRVETTAQASFVLVLLYIFSLSFAPFLIQTRTGVVESLSDFSFVKYVYAVLAITEFSGGLTIEFAPKGYDFAMSIDGQVILNNYNMDASRLAEYQWRLIQFVLVLVVLGFASFWLEFNSWRRCASSWWSGTAATNKQQ